MIDWKKEEERAKAMNPKLRRRLERAARIRGLNFQTVIITSCSFGWRVTIYLERSDKALEIEHIESLHGSELAIRLGSARLILNEASLEELLDVLGILRLRLI